MSNQFNKIKSQRNKLAYSPRELANLSNIKEQDLLQYESGKKKAKLTTIEKIAISTNTKISDWVDKDYFIKEKPADYINLDEAEDIALNFFRSLSNSDNVMDILYTAFIDMKEIMLDESSKVLLSEFSEKIIFNIYSLKLKEVFKACGRNELLSTNLDFPSDKLKKHPMP